MGGNTPASPEAMAAQTFGAFNIYGPGSANVLRSSFIPLSGDAARQNLQNYRNYAPGMNRVYNRMYNQNAMNEVRLNNQLVNSGAASRMMRGAEDLQRQVDPQWYQQRDRLNNELNNLPEQSYLRETGSGMSGSETAEMSRNLARYQGARGNAPGGSGGGNLGAIENAMAFGEAGHNRLLSNRAENRETAAFRPTLRSNTMGSLRSGMDAFRMTTGRPSGGAPGISSDGGPGMGFANQMWGGFGSNAGLAAGANASRMGGAQSVLQSLPSYS